MKKALPLVLLALAAGCLSGVMIIRGLNLHKTDQSIKAIPVQAVISNSKSDEKDSSINTVSESKRDPSDTTDTQNSTADKADSKTESNSAEIKSGDNIGSYDMTGEKVIYLTFDDGPSENTPKILDILDKYNIKATFFVTGFKTDYADYIKIEHDKGHTVGMHTYTHDYSKIYRSESAYFDDLNKIGQLCKEQLGYIPHYIRFPGGSSNTISAEYSKGIMSKLAKEVIKKGYQYYDWNSGNGDAVAGNPTADTLYKNAIKFAGGTDLVMLSHDSADKNSTVEALPKIIEYYQKQGYTFKPIDDKSFVPHHRINN